MNARPVFHLIAFVLLVIGAAMAVCWGLSYYFIDPASARAAFRTSAAITLAVGAVLAYVTRGPINLGAREGFGIVAFGWIAATLFGALPYLLSGLIPHYVSAMFETMSGFTTTGASVLAELEGVPRSLLFWRALTHWFGGMGVLVLCVAILPFLGVGGMQLFRAEMSGPSKDRLTPRITSTAKLLWGVYVLLCLAEIALLRLGGMNLFDSICHTFATIATGGFSTRTASIGAYNSLYIEMVVVAFMFLSGINFSLHYHALRGQPGGYFRNPEFRVYLVIWLAACLLLTFNIWGSVYATFGAALRAAVFQGTSMMTTTGFCTADFDRWPDFSRTLLILLMFVGGCAGSTSGSIKVVRVIVLAKTAWRELRTFMVPQAVLTVKLGPKSVDKESVRHIITFVAIFLSVFGLATLAMTLYTPDIETAFSSVIATMAGVGPGLAGVGAVQNYGAIPAMGKTILIFCMLVGRLELFTVLVLFLPSFWKK